MYDGLDDVDVNDDLKNFRIVLNFFLKKIEFYFWSLI